MVTVAPRSSWAVERNEASVRQVVAYKGAAVHWPGLSGQLGLDTHGRCLDLLRTLEHNAKNPKPGSGRDTYAAIPYQVIVCAHGLTEGRTVQRVNGANGSTAANTSHGSVMVLVGTADTVTDVHKRLTLESLAYLNAPRLVTHNSVRPSGTACPGPQLTKWIEAGAPVPPRPTPTPEDDPVKYLSISRKASAPLSVPAGKWSPVKFDVESSDDWSGHATGSAQVKLPKSGIVHGAAQLVTDVALEARIMRGVYGSTSPAPSVIAALEAGPGPFMLTLPPSVSNGQAVWIDVRPAVAGKVSGSFRLALQDRVTK